MRTPRALSWALSAFVTISSAAAIAADNTPTIHIPNAPAVFETSAGECYTVTPGAMTRIGPEGAPPGGQEGTKVFYVPAALAERVRDARQTAGEDYAIGIITDGPGHYIVFATAPLNTGFMLLNTPAIGLAPVDAMLKPIGTPYPDDAFHVGGEITGFVASCG